jgi:predicted LPLAT superfamily acyltransferase
VNSWEGKTRGSLTGYKIFVWVLKYLGISFAYFLLKFVILYYIFFSPRSFRVTYDFYRNRLSMKVWKSLLFVVRNFYVFGQVLIDKVAVMAGFRAKFLFDFDGEHYLRKMAEDKTGGLLISAHVGNFEMAGFMLERLKTTINIIMFDAEHARIKNYLSSVAKRNFNVIVIKEDQSHIYEINKAFSEKQIVCIHGDRFVQGSKTITAGFLGSDAPFPTGPFYLAMKYNIPVSFVFAMKEKRNKYHFYATPSLYYQQESLREKRDKTIALIISDYIKELEKIIIKYPEQWFNYYDFWKKPT